MTEELKDFLKELDEEGFKASTIDAFEETGLAMVDAGMTGVADKLRSLKAAVAGEYGD